MLARLCPQDTKPQLLLYGVMCRFISVCIIIFSYLNLFLMNEILLGQFYQAP